MDAYMYDRSKSYYQCDIGELTIAEKDWGNCRPMSVITNDCLSVNQLNMWLQAQAPRGEPYMYDRNVETCQ